MTFSLRRTLAVLSLGCLLGTSSAWATAVADTSGRPAPSFQLRQLKQFFVADSFQAASWDAFTINIYREDVTKMTDTFQVVLNDPANGKRFTFPIQGRVTSGFGPRRFWGVHYHFGTDVKLQTGDTIVSAMDGIVRVVRWEPGYGNFIVIAHPDGLETLYGHLSKVLVQSGDRVRSGELIGLGGSTGKSTGPHLHFEFRFLGQQFDAARVIDFNEGEVIADTFHIDASWFKHLVEMRAARYHVIRRGDTLGHIARRYGTSITRLCRLNGMSTRSLLRPGRRLRVN